MGVLEGKVAVVTGASSALGAGLALALSDAGAAVTRLAQETSLRTREEAEAAFATAGAPVDVLVHAAVDPGTTAPVAFEDIDDASFDLAWEQAMRTTIWCCQAAFAHMQRRGGRIVLVTPTASMSGAPGHVAWTMGVEGQRLLAKSAARQWGPEGITVNCIAPAPEHVLGDAYRSDAVSLAPPALGGIGDPAADLGRIAVFLASDDSRFLTGSTLTADGGVWMSP